MVTMLEDLYSVPAYYFTTFTTPYADNIQTGIKALEKQKEILSATPGIQNISVPADTHLSIAKMAFDALISKHEQILLLMQVKELVVEMNRLKSWMEPPDLIDNIFPCKRSDPACVYFQFFGFMVHRYNLGLFLLRSKVDSCAM